MVVDVIDLNFKTLNFSKKYDTARYSRAKRIYRNNDVEIKEVNKVDSNKYNVKAGVYGNYGYYNIKFDINGSIINNCSCTCDDYKNGYLCKHIIATSMEVIEPHNASTINGVKRLEAERIKKHKEEMERLRKLREEENRRREYEQKYSYGLQAINSFKPTRSFPSNDDNNYLDVNTVYQRALLNKNKKEALLATSITIEPKLEYLDSETLGLSFKIGQGKMYMFKNIQEFYEAYRNQEELEYGKQLKFVPKRENFTKESKAYFDYIIDYAQIVEFANKFSRNRYSAPEFSNKEIYITGNKIEEILKLMNYPNIFVRSYYDGNKEYKFTDEDLKIEYSLDKEIVEIARGLWLEPEESEEYVLKLNISANNVLYSSENVYIFQNNKIYTKKREKELLDLLSMFKYHERILIPEDKLNEFQQYVVPKSKYIDKNNLPAEIVKEGEIVNQLASKILLDVNDDGDVILELRFCYNDCEFNILESNNQKNIKDNNVIRDVPSETDVLNRIFQDGFELIPERKYFLMRNEEEIYNFLRTKIEGYMKDYEVLATDAFKNKEIKQPKISSVGVKVNNGLLEVDISKINIDIAEIKDILKDYRIKKKYHRLKNGDFLDLDNNEDLNILDEMTSTLDIDYSKIENGIIYLPFNRSIYLDKLLDANKSLKTIKNEEFLSVTNKFENRENADNIKIDKDLDKILRDYQKDGYRWLKTIEMYKFGGILADDMGLGKTIQIISLLKSYLKEKKRKPSIVVCPSTLVLNWKAEVEKWCSGINTIIIKGKMEDRKKLIDTCNNYDLVLTSYDLLKRDIDEYENIDFKYIIADEAQYIKNFSTQNATALKKLKGEIKYALTGTPIENSVAELWSIFDYIMPGYLYNYNKFKKKFEQPILKEENKEALTRLKKLISPFVLRRVKEDVLTELPEKNITIMKSEMEPEQEKIYLSYLAQTKKEIAEELGENSFEKSKFKILMLLTRLRQICCHPSLFIENYKGTSGKLEQCIDLVNDAIESNHKILLFSSYTSMFNIIEKELKRNKIEYFKLIGDTPVDKRIEMVDEFNSNKEVKVFLISLKSGGTGLNLTSADIVIHYDPWWNVSSENQATDRAYRKKKKNSVQVYKLITSNSIEEKINKMQERKEKLSKDLLSTEETFINKLSKEEIMELFE